MSFKHELELARTWRERQGTDCERSLGYVVIFNGSVAGWKRELDFPQGWEPGCLAISPEGEVFQAVGGNDYDGAEAWQALAENQPRGFTPLSATQAARRLRLLLDQKSEQLDGRKTSAQEPVQAPPFQVIEKPQARDPLCIEYQLPRFYGAEQ